MNRHTFSNALKQLEKIGFITKEQSGGLYRRRNIFRFSAEWRKHGQSPSAINGTVDGAKSGTIEEGKGGR